jgi:spore coat protein JB
MLCRRISYTVRQYAHIMYRGAAFILTSEEYLIVDNNNKAGSCGYKNGSLPGACAPLAMAYVPMQQSPAPAYGAPEALQQGTLFPGLELPFMGMVNTGDIQNTPLRELMALDFAADELELYLDTHTDDAEAFDMYQDVLALSAEAHKRYTELYGPVSQSDMLGMKNYYWIKDPWPWNYCGGTED